MPATQAMPARCAGDEAANGGHYDHDRGTRYEGLVHAMPRFRAQPSLEDRIPAEHWRKIQAQRTAKWAPSRAVERAKRRKLRRDDRRFGPKGRGRLGMLGLLDALNKPLPPAA